MREFTVRVLKIVGEIPRGKLLTYKEVAARAGSLRACRAVGSILRRAFRQKTQLPLTDFPAAPCHRVIRSDGFVGGYANGREAKEQILKSEGHRIENHKISVNSPNMLK